MALSYYTNWDSEMMNFPAQAETDLLQELFNDNFGFFPETSCEVNIDHLFEPNNFLYAAENCNPLFPNYLPNPTDYNFDTSFVEFDPFHIQKRQKIHDYELINSVFPEVVLPDFLNAPINYNVGSCETATKAPGGASLSAQSIAARQRRRKITEKTQELSKLVPGGPKMNTAEMLQSAYKYIKFLQAQVGILDYMGSCNHHQENGELSDLLGSTLIQEKLYSTEKCLVPEKFVQELATDHHSAFESKPELLNEVRELGTKIGSSK